MAGSVDVQLRNAQSAILFMQQEHAKTLQGLHAELQKLQKKCAELTFELAMKSEDVHEEQYKQQQEELEKRLGEKEEEVHTLEVHVQDRDAKIVHLEQQLRHQEKNQIAESMHHEQKISSLTHELDKKSANIAYLTNQLRQMALVKHKTKEHISSNRVPSTSPHPPQRPLPSQRRRVRTPTAESVSLLNKGRVVTTLSDSYDRGSFVDQAARHSRRLSSPGASRSYDDREVAAFLAKVDTATSDIEIKPAPPILPPISPFPQERRNSHNSPYYSRRSVRVSKPLESAEHTQIGSLAVQAAHSSKKDLHASQHSKGESPS